jgi:DNA-binding SARP family transcriptional activator/tetratricopeptide (TPR) repeat protein
VSSGWDIRLLGRFVVLRDGEELPPGAFVGRLSKRLLRILAIARGELRTKEALADDLWADRPPADPSGNLEVLVARIRRGLGDPSLILTGAGGYALADDPRCSVDTADLLDAVDRGRGHLAAGNTRAALAEFLRALDRWGGEPLVEDLYEDWAQTPRSALVRAHLEALEGGAAAALAVGDGATAASMAARAVEREPLREPAYLLLARGRAVVGDTAGALAAIAILRERMAEELGLDPSEEALAIQRALLRGDLLPAVASAGEAPMETPADRTPFVGRREALAAVLSNEPSIWVLGPPGSGKSRLLEEATARSTEPVLLVRAYEPERNEPWALGRSLLREALARDALSVRAVADVSLRPFAAIVPDVADLRDLPPGAPDPASAHALAIEAALRILEVVTGNGAVAMVDDAQWCDATSAHLIAVACARLPLLRIVIAARLDGTLDTMRAEVGAIRPPVRLTLGPLSVGDVEEVLANRPLAASIAEGTDGSPLAVFEAIHALEEADVLRPDGRGRWRARGRIDGGRVSSAVAAAVRQALASRLARVTGSALHAARAVAIVGREIPTRTVAAIAGLDRSVALEELTMLTRAGIVRSGELGWVAAHDAIAEAILDRFAAEDLVALHDRVAEVLRDEDGDPAEVARHRAAAGDRADAAAAYLAAAERALTAFAQDEAAELATLGIEQARAMPRAHGLLLRTRAEARIRSGALADAGADLREAIAITPPGPARAPWLSRLAMLESGSEDLVRAAELVEVALGEAREDPAARAEVLSVGSIVDMNLGDLERAEARADEALGLYRSIGDGRGAAGILDGRAMATFMGGDIRRAADAFDRVAKLFEDSGELFRVGTPRSTRGHALVFLARPADGLADIERALELELSLGHDEGVSYASWHRAEALAALGRVDEALATATEAITIAQRIDHREWTAASLRGLGIAHEAAGDFDAAIETHRRSLAASEGMPMFAAWANARLATCLARCGRVEEAARVAAAATMGPPLSSFEIEVARAEVAAASGSPDAAAVASRAAQRCEEGGYLAALPRLAELGAR